LIVDSYFFTPLSPMKAVNKSSCGRARMWELMSSPTLAAALEPASTFGRGFGTGVHSGFHAADVAFAEDGNQSAADGDGFDKVDVGGFHHGIAGFDAADVTFRFDHA
jgi:hypothetical protein